MAYNSNYRAPVNDVMKSNEHLTNAHLANLKKPALCTNTRMKIYLLRLAVFFTKTAQILQKIQPQFVKQEAILIIFQVIAESISQSNP